MDLDANVNNQIFRKDYPVIIAKNRHLASLAPVRLVSTGSDYQAGTVLAKNSTSGLFQAYANGGASGTGTAVCVLMETITDDPVNGSMVGRGIFAGELYKDNLVGLDSGAITNLGAKSYQASDGVNILKF